MSAIGDYVHLTARGYEQHGTFFYGQNTSNYNDAIGACNRIKMQTRNRINNTSKNTDYSELEKSIENLMIPPNVDNEQTKALNELWELLEKEFRQQFETEVPLQIQRNFGNILAGDYAELTVSSIAPGKKDIYLNTILKRIGDIERSKENISNQMNRNALEKILKNIYQELNNITGIGEKALYNTGYNLSLNNSNIRTGKKFKITEMENIISQINRIVATTAGVANLRKGDLFEYLIAFAPFVGGKKVVDNLREYIQSAVVGTTGKSKVTFEPSRFIQGVDFKKILGSTYTYNPNNQLYETVKGVQDKVDVKIEWRGQPFNISAKNINLSKGFNISLVSGASLLSMLSMMETDFVNHYLNIISKHEDKRIENSLVNAAHNAIKPALLLQALEGYRPTDKAELFIINDNSSNEVGKVKVFDILLLAEKAINNNLYDVEANGVDITNISFNNYKEATYTQRITKLLASVHAQKIHVSLKPNIVNLKPDIVNS